MGLFICLEISPVLIKLISSVGPYDYLLEKTENEFKLYSKEKIRKGNSLTIIGLMILRMTLKSGKKENKPK
jgi:hypothetical protein